MSVNKFTGKKPAKRTSPAPGRKVAGGQSPNHRGYRADAAAPAKKRWNADERAGRTGDGPARTDRRPDWTPREERPQRSERPSYGDRPQRSERPSYGDRPQRTERPSYNDRPARTERPAYGDRPQRSERPAYGDRPARTERPSYCERPKRTERVWYKDCPVQRARDRYGGGG